MDLFTPIVDEGMQHQNFKNILIENNDYTKDVIREWAVGFVDRDNKFVEEFQKSFNSCLWELYLHACLKKMQLSIDFNFNRPDFVVKDASNGTSFTIECVTANHAEGCTPEWVRDISTETLEGMNLDEMVDNSTLRLSNAIGSKYDRYVSSYYKLDHVKNKPFVIAVAPFDQPFFQFPSLQPIWRVLYGFDRMVKVNERFYEPIYKESIVKSKNGSTVNLGLFTAKDLEEVSAILFSCTATYGKIRALSKDSGPLIFDTVRYNKNSTKSVVGVNYRDHLNKLPRKFYKKFAEEFKDKIDTNQYEPRNPYLLEDYSEDLQDGLHLLLNPFAKHPIDVQIFKDLGASIHNYDYSNKEIMVDCPDNFLYQRLVNRIKVR